jgi:ribosome biogenesis GTPase
MILSPQVEQAFLDKFGWDDFFATQMRDVDISGVTVDALRPARVIGEERGSYRVQISLRESSSAVVSGKLQFGASGREAFPAVGDWVLFERAAGAERGTIHYVFERKSLLYRKQVGSSAEMQILSTNVDFVFITTSVNDELNHRRIERYLSIARESKVDPVILLTKADVAGDSVAEVLAQIQERFSGVAAYAISREGFAEAAFLARYLTPGRTIVVIGSSGVGKSTLVNFLIGDEQIRTQGIRESDGRGRHTTTSRALYVSRFGGLIIDTPGMREMQLSDHAEGVQNHFEDIEKLAARCKFRDCQHGEEPGCAIRKALQEQTLEAGRWANFQKLQAEVAAGLRKTEKVMAAKQQRAWKKASFEAKHSADPRRNSMRPTKRIKFHDDDSD